MTGHGEAQRQQDGAAIGVEVRTVNNRFLKISAKVSDGYGALEPLLETLVRQQLRRGTVQVSVRIVREPSADEFRLNESVLSGYRRQLESLNQSAGVSDAVRLEALLALPGVVNETARQSPEVDAVWPLLEETLLAALDNLSRMRADEGAAMAADLCSNCETISAQLREVERQAPTVVEAYRRRLSERLNKLLAEYEISLEPSDVVREVGIFADRSDVSEEIVRLRSHLEQFETIAQGADSNGRKLEFVLQEMLRETNTIGSKANDAGIARHVVEIKTALERMREMIQNVE